MRIYISESDQANHHNLMKEILNHLHEEHQVHGATVFRGIAGFGAKHAVHSADLLRPHADLPLVIEFFDDAATVDQALTWIKQLVPSSHTISLDAQLE